MYRQYVETTSKPAHSTACHNFFQEKQKLHSGLYSEASGMMEESCQLRMVSGWERWGAQGLALCAICLAE